MKIIITESQYAFIRRLPAVEEELNKHLKRVDPTKFDIFQRYIDYLAKVTLMYLPDDLFKDNPRGEKYDLRTEFREHIIYGLRHDIRKIYDSGKPASLFGE
jgi:hypothetical protein